MTGTLSKREARTGLSFSGVSSVLSLAAAADFEAVASGDADGCADVAVTLVSEEEAGAFDASGVGVAVGVGVGDEAKLLAPPPGFCEAKRISRRLKEARTRGANPARSAKETSASSPRCST